MVLSVPQAGTALLFLLAGLVAMVVGPLPVMAQSTLTSKVAITTYDWPGRGASTLTVAGQSGVRRGPADPGPQNAVGASARTLGFAIAAETGGGGLLSRLRAINWADDTGSISLPGNRLRPNYAAEGPHSTFRTGPDGSVTHYATWEPQSNPLNPAPWQMVKRVDVVGDPHFNKVTGTYVDTPHVQGSSIPGGVRPAEPWELP